MAYGVNAPFGLRPLQSISGGSWTEKTNAYWISPGYNISIFEGDPVVLGTSIAATIPANGGIGTIAQYNPSFTQAVAGGGAAMATFSTVPLLGVFISCEYFDVNNKLQQSQYYPAGVQTYNNQPIKAFILDDPDVVYDIQISTHYNAAGNVAPAAFATSPVFPNTNAIAGVVDNGNPIGSLAGSVGSCFALNIGGGTNFNLIPNKTGGFYANNPQSGSTISGQSAFYLDVNTGATAANPPVATANFDYNKTLATLPLKVIGLSQNPKNIAAPGLTLATTPFLNVRVMINNHVYRAGTPGTTIVA